MARRYIMKRKFLVTIAILAVACWAPGAYAATLDLTFPASPQNTSNVLAASAHLVLDPINDILTITLTNTSTVNTPDNAAVLFALFWQGCDLAAPVNVNTGVALPAGGTVWMQNPGDSFATDVTGVSLDGTWGYGQGFNLLGFGTPGGNFGPGLYNGVSAVGYSINGSPSFPASVDGEGFGLVSAGFDPSNPLDGVANAPNPEIQNAVILTLTGFTCDDLADMHNFTFAYGTTMNVVPIPPSAILLGTGLLGLVGLRRFRKS
jgi:hypothetical protein